MDKGIFTISLDFELHWGVSETKRVEDYQENLANTPTVVARLLKLFETYEIHATWATVGKLFAPNKAALVSLLASTPLPKYDNAKLSNYGVLATLDSTASKDPYHFAPELIKLIGQTPHQEIATHTFSHFYCLEKGPNQEDFDRDLQLARSVAAPHNIALASIVFPRNQYSPQHLATCSQHAIKAYRGNEQHWIYQPRSRTQETQLRRILRLIDAYLPITGSHIHDLSYISAEKGLKNIPSSRFLRPYHPKLNCAEPLRLHRINSELKRAGKQKGIFHLWWHPHNFGRYVDKNFEFLQRILDQYKRLEEKGELKSLNMKEISLL